MWYALPLRLLHENWAFWIIGFIFKLAKDSSYHLVGVFIWSVILHLMPCSEIIFNCNFPNFISIYIWWDCEWEQWHSNLIKLNQSSITCIAWLAPCYLEVISFITLLLFFFCIHLSVCTVTMSHKRNTNYLYIFFFFSDFLYNWFVIYC